jgi:hypothetical protein
MCATWKRIPQDWAAGDPSEGKPFAQSEFACQKQFEIISKVLNLQRPPR